MRPVFPDENENRIKRRKGGGGGEIMFTGRIGWQSVYKIGKQG